MTQSIPCVQRPAEKGQRTMSHVKIGVVQFELWKESDDPKQTLELCRTRLEAWFDKAAGQALDVLVFPEAVNLSVLRPQSLFHPHIVDWKKIPELLMARRFARKARCNVILPLIAQVNNKFRNCAFIVNRQGRVVGRYDKVHLTVNEKTTGVAAGNSFPAFDLDFGRIGVMICHDMSFVESARCLRLSGADLVFWPSMWSGWGDELSWTVIKSRAIDNSQYLVFASYGQNPADPNWTSGVKSHSSVINPEGLILAQAERFPTLLTCDIDLSRRRVAPWFTQGKDDLFLDAMLSERRPEAYASIVQTGAQSKRRSTRSRKV
jgi:predicted amidohydrolase